MNQLLNALNARCGWDCVVQSYDGWRLRLASGASPAYARPLVAFAGVRYLALPVEFSHPQFRMAGQAEREQLGRLVPLAAGDLVVAIEAETMAGLVRQTFFLVAEGLELAEAPPALAPC